MYSYIYTKPKVNKALYKFSNENMVVYNNIVSEMKIELNNIFTNLKSNDILIETIRENIKLLLDILSYITEDNYNEYIIICEQLLCVDKNETDISVYQSYLEKIIENRSKIEKLI
jgi:hypothetical protein